MLANLGDQGSQLGETGDPDSCIQGIKKYEEIGVDQLIMLMQTESVPHDKVMRSIEMFGKHVIPAFQNAKAGAKR